MKVKDLPMINYIERTINEVVIDEIEKGLLDEKAPKIIKLSGAVCPEKDMSDYINSVVSILFTLTNVFTFASCRLINSFARFSKASPEASGFTLAILRVSFLPSVCS